MSSDLTFLTNEPGKSLRDRFSVLLRDGTQFFDCLVGYFFISGFYKLYPALEDVETIEQEKRLVGTTRLILDEEPNNIALRFLSVCARVQGGTESDSSVLQEATTLTNQVVRNGDELENPSDIFLSMLEQIFVYREKLLTEIGDMVFRKAGDRYLAQFVLKSNKLKNNKTLRSHSIILLSASAVNAIKQSTFLS